MVLLGGVGEALILKWIGGKLVGALGTHLAHSSAAVVTNFAMHSTIATTSAVTSAASTGGAFAAFSALHDGASANWDLAKDVIEKREKLNSTDNSMSDEQMAHVLFGMTLIMLAEGYYQSLEHKGKSGTLKTALNEMEPCKANGCGCTDYQRTSSWDSDCKSCEHSSARHTKIDESDLMAGNMDALEWLYEGIARQIYPHLQNIDGEGNSKVELGQIDTCADQNCPCFDFDLSQSNTLFSRRCSCGHRYREHVVTGQWNWIPIQLAQHLLVQMVEEDD